jgi:hypothetical protein
MQKLLFRTPLVYAFIFASALYHDRIWYAGRGRKTVRQWLGGTGWGRLFAGYRPGQA